MKIKNFICLNDWSIRNFIIFIITLQCIVLSLIFLDIIGFDIPIAQEIISFIYLSYVPGIIILRILRVHKINNIETLSYSVGLSLSILMLVGFLINIMFTFLNLPRPISLIPLTVTITLLVIFLCYLAYRVDKKFDQPSYINLKNIINPLPLFLILLPFICVFGTYLVNYHNINSFLILLMLLIGITLIIAIFKRNIHKSTYPLAIWTISISLLFFTSLISNYLVGSDVHDEFFFANMVLKNGIWSWEIFRLGNGVMSTNILAPIYVIYMDFGLNWVFKIVYPLLYSLLSLILYHIYREQTNDRFAFLATFFFISNYIFFTTMLGLGKQIVAELFLALLFCSMLSENLNQFNSSILMIVFAASLIFSHYGVSYLYIIIFLAVYLILIILNKYKSRIQIITQNDNKNSIKKLSLTFVLFSVTLALAWYFYTSSSSAFTSLVHIVYNIYSAISGELLTPETPQGLNLLLTEQSTFLHNITKYLTIITQFFVLIGLVKILFGKTRFTEEYRIFALVNFSILILSIILPFFSKSFGTVRLYHLTLIILSPLCILGGLYIFDILSSLLKRIRTISLNKQQSFKIMTIFLVIVFYFNSGVVYEISQNPSKSLSLSQERIKHGSIKEKAEFYAVYINDQDYYGIEWMNQHRVDHLVLSDFSSVNYLISYGNMGMSKRDILSLKKLEIVPRDANYYIYLGYLPTKYGVGFCVTSEGGRKTSIIKITKNEVIFRGSGKIYDNGGSELFFK